MNEHTISHETLTRWLEIARDAEVGIASLASLRKLRLEIDMAAHPRVDRFLITKEEVASIRFLVDSFAHDFQRQCNVESARAESIRRTLDSLPPA